MAASLAQLETALRNAHAAGDSAAARTIAAAIQSQRPPPAAPESGASSIIGAAVEPNLALASGMVAAPVSGLVGLAGTLSPGPPGQGAQWARHAQERLTYKPVTEGGKTALEAISYPFRKYGEGTTWLGEKTAELSGSPAAGAAVKTVADVGAPLALSRALRMPEASQTPQATGARTLMQSSVKPLAADIESGAAKRAVGTMLEEGINPTTGGMEKLHRLATSLNRQVEASIAASPETVNVARVGSRLRDPYMRAQTQVNPSADVAAVRSAWDEFAHSPSIRGKTEIPVQLAHALKKGTYRALGDKSYGELGTASTESQKALARGLREETLAKVPETAAPLAREANLMNVLSVAERRAIMEANKNPMGLALLARNPYAWAGFMADRSAAFKGAVAKMLYATGDPNAARTALATMGTAQTQEGP